jgi:hypothetical protein
MPAGYTSLDTHEPNEQPDSPDPRLRTANIVYAVLFVVVGVLCSFLNSTGSKWLGHIVKSSYDHDDRMMDITLVARTSSALAVFFALHGLCTMCNVNLVDSWQYILHVALPGLHYLLFIAVYAIFLFVVPDSFFVDYIYFAYFASGIYLFLQFVFLIDSFHTINERFVETDKFPILMAGTIVLSLGAVAGYGVGFWEFRDTPLIKIVLGANLGVTALLYIASLLIEHGSIFTASLIAVYVSFLTFTGASRWGTAKSANVVAATVLCSLMVLGWVCRTAFRNGAQLTTGCGSEKPTFSISAFHFVFALASVYLAMLTTQWDEGDTATWPSAHPVAAWVNWASSWLVLLLYLWTLIAPLILTNREF